MKAAKLYQFSDIRIEEVPVPEVGPDEALLKVKASGICTGDVMPWYIEKKAPLVPGHELSGEIAAVGINVRSVSTGDRVVAHHHAPCMACRHCQRRDYVQCATWKSSNIIPGGIAEYVLIPGTILNNDTLVLPDNVRFEDAALVEPLACVVKSIRRSGIRQGDTVLVIGLGVMGMMHILLARHNGAESIIGADKVDFRLDRALKLGADAVTDVRTGLLHDDVRARTDNRGADLVIVGPNSAEAMEEGLQCAAPGGTVVFFTPAKPGEKLIIDPNYHYFRDTRIVNSYSCGPDDTSRALALVAEGVVTAEQLVTHRFGIDETSKAYRLVAEARESLKVLITFP